MSATFSTPLREVLDWPWDEVARWWHVARSIDAERWEPMRAVRDLIGEMYR